ncbi:hypothetical protein SLE2022_246460 [Rubroshorea leprosula]
MTSDSLNASASITTAFPAAPAQNGNMVISCREDWMSSHSTTHEEEHRTSVTVSDWSHHLCTLRIIN